MRLRSSPQRASNKCECGKGTGQNVHGRDHRKAAAPKPVCRMPRCWHLFRGDGQKGRLCVHVQDAGPGKRFLCVRWDVADGAIYVGALAEVFTTVR
jgi:hypothetical protein